MASFCCGGEVPVLVLKRTHMLVLSSKHLPRCLGDLARLLDENIGATMKADQRDLNVASGRPPRPLSALTQRWIGEEPERAEAREGETETDRDRDWNQGASVVSHPNENVDGPLNGGEPIRDDDSNEKQNRQERREGQEGQGNSNKDQMKYAFYTMPVRDLFQLLEQSNLVVGNRGISLIKPSTRMRWFKTLQLSQLFGVATDGRILAPTAIASHADWQACRTRLQTEVLTSPVHCRSDARLESEIKMRFEGEFKRDPCTGPGPGPGDRPPAWWQRAATSTGWLPSFGLQTKRPFTALYPASPAADAARAPPSQGTALFPASPWPTRAGPNGKAQPSFQAVEACAAGSLTSAPLQWPNGSIDDTKPQTRNCLSSLNPKSEGLVIIARPMGRRESVLHNLEQPLDLTVLTTGSDAANPPSVSNSDSDADAEADGEGLGDGDGEAELGLHLDGSCAMEDGKCTSHAHKRTGKYSHLKNPSLSEVSSLSELSDELDELTISDQSSPGAPSRHRLCRELQFERGARGKEGRRQKSSASDVGATDASDIKSGDSRGSEEVRHSKDGRGATHFVRSALKKSSTMPPLKSDEEAGTEADAERGKESRSEDRKKAGSKVRFRNAGLETWTVIVKEPEDVGSTCVPLPQCAASICVDGQADGEAESGGDRDLAAVNHPETDGGISAIPWRHIHPGFAGSHASRYPRYN